MALVASSKSAKTELPREQNQPGRRLAHAAQPAGTCLERGFMRGGNPVVIPASVIATPFPTPEKYRPLRWPFNVSRRGRLAGSGRGTPQKRFRF